MVNGLGLGAWLMVWAQRMVNALGLRRMVNGLGLGPRLMVSA